MNDLAHTVSQFTRSLVFALTACFSAVIFTGAVQAQDQLVLREQVKVFSDLVTLGDLFENAGVVSSAPVFRSPELGTNGVVAAKRVAAAAQQHGAEWSNPGDIGEVVVQRPSRKIEIDEIKDIIARNAADDGEVWTVSFDRGTKPFHLNPRVKAPISIKHLDLQRKTGRFRAVLSVEDAGSPVQDKIYTGRAYPTVEAIVPDRVIDRGATIVAEDLKTVRLPRSQVSTTAIEDAETAIGMAAKHRLIVGRPVRRGDLEHPKLVKRNESVTIVYRVPGMVLKAKGRALGDATRGQTVPIKNLQSNRTVEARVTGTGIVSVSGQQPSPSSQPRRSVRNKVSSKGGKNSFFIR